MTNRMCASFILSVFLCCTAAARTIPGTSLSPAVWYQSNNVVTDEYGNTESITDLSGGGNHASQPNSACRPALDAGVLPNGRPALLFDGNDSLQMSRPLLLTNCVCFAVVRPNITDYSVSSVRNKTILGGNKQSMQWIIRQKESGTLHSEVLCRSVKSCGN